MTILFHEFEDDEVDEVELPDLSWPPSWIETGIPRREHESDVQRFNREMLEKRIAEESGPVVRYYLPGYSPKTEDDPKTSRPKVRRKRGAGKSRISPAVRKKVLKLKVDDDLSRREIADRVGIKINAVDRILAWAVRGEIIERIEPGIYCWAGDEESRERARERMFDLSGFISAVVDKGIPVADASKSFNITPRTGSVYMRRAIQRGEVERVAAGVYRRRAVNEGETA